MNLDEMKTLWEDMSKELAQQKILTDKLVIEMTQEKYNNRIRKISVPEIIGGALCFVMAIFIFINIGKLDTWYLLLSGILCIAYFILLPLAVFGAIKGLRNVNIAGHNYKDVLLKFAKKRARFLFFQKIGIGFNFVLLIITLPVAGKIMDGKDLFLESGVWMWYLPIGFTFLFFFSRWAWRYLVNSTSLAGNVLREIEG